MPFTNAALGTIKGSQVVDCDAVSLHKYSVSDEAEQSRLRGEFGEQVCEAVSIRLGDNYVYFTTALGGQTSYVHAVLWRDGVAQLWLEPLVVGDHTEVRIGPLPVTAVVS